MGTGRFGHSPLSFHLPMHTDSACLLVRQMFQAGASDALRDEL